MKTLLSLVLVLVLACVSVLAGCDDKSMNYIIGNEACITGVVKEVGDRWIVVEGEDFDYTVSLDVENEDGLYGPIVVGDEVAVYYGELMESYPPQLGTIYAITLLNPADRSVNDVS